MSSCQYKADWQSFCFKFKGSVKVDISAPPWENQTDFYSIETKQHDIYICTIPHLDGPLHPLGPSKASSWPYSDLHGARQEGRPTAPESPAADSLKTGGQSVRPGSDNQRMIIITFIGLDEFAWMYSVGIHRLQFKLFDTTYFEGTWGHITAAAEPHLFY